MRIPSRLDRAWTYTVWAAYALMVPIWLVMSWEKHPALAIIQAVLIVWFLASEALSEFRRETRRNPSHDTPDLPRIP